MKRVIVIEDHTAVRQMICQLVESIPGGDVPNLVIELPKLGHVIS